MRTTLLLLAAVACILAACAPAPPSSIEPTSLPTGTPLPPLPSETPACQEVLIPPIIQETEPVPALPGGTLRVIGYGGHTQDSCGGYNESARPFQLYLDDKYIGDLVCYVNRCEATTTLPGSLAPGLHCLSIEPGSCDYEFSVAVP